MKRAIVLSGGGAKGAYQIGVWKALRKLNIKYDIVTGTSIGSVNGLLMVQNEYHKALHIWKNIGYSDLFDVDFKNSTNVNEVYKKYAKEFLKNGGIETSKMYDFLCNAYNEKKFKNSNIDYGVVTVNLTKMKPTVVKKSDNNKNLLKYILASGTCYPAFQLTNIDDCKYIDGGYYDNLPLQTAIDLGAEEIIAVDIGVMGIKKKIKNKDIKIKYIVPKNDIGEFLVFDKHQSRKSIDYGYNDTMKAYDKLDGDKYTFEYGSLLKNYNNIGIEYFKHIKKYYKNKSESKMINNILDYSKYSKLLNKKDFNYLYKTLNQTIEYAASLLKLEDFKIYSINSLNYNLKKNIKKFEPFSKKHVRELIKNKNLKRRTSRRAIMVFIYKELSERKLSNIEFLLLINIYNKEFLSALYIYML